MAKTSTLKLYCYVDETGQDTGGRLFIVAVVMTDDQRDKLRKDLQRIERASNKRQRKWTGASRQQRIGYIQAIIEIPAFKNLVSYSRYQDSRSYVDLTILSVAKAIHGKVDKTDMSYEANIFVDGMKRSEQHRFGAGVRKLGIKVRKARGLRDQSDEFIRLADAIAGFVRDALEDDTDMKTLFKRAVKAGIITNV
jgi:hypothetical protein